MGQGRNMEREQVGKLVKTSQRPNKFLVNNKAKTMSTHKSKEALNKCHHYLSYKAYKTSESKRVALMTEG